MDIEPEDNKYYKNDWLNQSPEEGLSSKSKINSSTIFKHSYFWTLYLLSASYIVDLIFYLNYYQEDFNIVYYEQKTYILRLINDIAFIFPILLFIKFQTSIDLKNYIIGGCIFLPQLVLSIISLVFINRQKYCTDEDILCDTKDIPEDEFVRRLTYTRITILRTTSLINLILYIIAIALTFLKIIKNY